MSETVFLTGGSGLLAVNWATALKNKKRIVLGMHERDITIPGVLKCRVDLTSPQAILDVFRIYKPDSVIHTAGLTNVELCEARPDLANHVNVELAVNVANAAQQYGIQMVQISTDHLYQGNAAFMDEKEPVAPRNIYGRTKAEAERAVLKIYPDALVIRSNFYGWGPVYRRSFSDMIIDGLRAKEKITLFEDVFYSPILARTLAETTHLLMQKNAHGIFSVVSNERISKHQFGQKVAARFMLDTAYIGSGLLADQPELVSRPVDMSLSNRKTVEFLGKEFASIDDQLEVLKDEEENGIAKEIKNL